MVELSDASIVTAKNAIRLIVAAQPKIAVTVSQRSDPCFPLNKLATSRITAGTICVEKSIYLPLLVMSAIAPKLGVPNAELSGHPDEAIHIKCLTLPSRKGNRHSPVHDALSDADL
ncbi:hypothetical protein BMS3Abin07_00127 [bacterium BMS3Abin07]|nr:hypothetical protein BMS3Abin07_00127 [bacterium BMS3Abin07]